MNDKERILTTIIRELESTMMLCQRRNFLYRDFDGTIRAQFVGTHTVKPKKGDIVKCNTQFGAEWAMAVFLEDCEGERGGYWLLQEIGGKRTVRMFNESLSVLIGMNPSTFYTGHQRQLFEWAGGKAFSKRYNPKADYMIRCGGVDFIDDVLRIWVRPHAWGMQKTHEGKTLYAVPYSIDLKWTEKTKLRDITDAMIAAGFPREWEWSEKEPDR